MVKILFLFILTCFFSPLSLASLSIPEVDPYEVLDKDRKKQFDKEKKFGKGKKHLTKEEKAAKRKKALPLFCDSADEFKQAYLEIKKSDGLKFPEKDIVHIAYQVTKGCDGAAERFGKVLQLLLKSGTDKKRSIEIALHFSEKTDEQAEAFALVYKGTLLEKYMDLDYKTALATSLHFALNVKGDPELAASDFRAILDYCLANKGAGLPFKTCAPYTLTLVDSSYLYEDTGLKDSFHKLMGFLAEQKEIEFTLPKALKIAAKVLRNGPLAVENFEKQYKFAISNPMNLPQIPAVELAIMVAESTIGPEIEE